MNKTESTTTDTEEKPAPPRRRAPRPRTTDRAAQVVAAPPGYARARTAFENRAQEWLLDRPGRTMQTPEDLRPIAALGVPCGDCGARVYRPGDAGHTIEWKPKQKGDPAGQHWAKGITAYCGKKA